MVQVQADPAAEFVRTLLAFNTLSGQFEQQMLDRDGRSLQTSQGQFQIRRPGYFRWQILPPYEQILVGTPQSLKVYDPDLEQMILYDAKVLAGSPAALISGDAAALAADYHITTDTDARRQVFILQSKAARQTPFERLTFAFSPDELEKRLEKIAFVDKLGQVTTITLSQLQLNRVIADQVFHFDPPADTDIIIDG